MTSPERQERPNLIEVKPGWIISLPPEFTELRPHQTQAIIEIVDKFNAGFKYVFLDAPTGAGKTVIGEAVRQLRVGQFMRGLYLCTTKTLQEQFLSDFPDAKLIKGKANYPTFDEPIRFFEGGIRHLDANLCDIESINSSMVPYCTKCEEHDPDEDYEPSDPKDPKVRHCSHCHPWQSCPYRTAKWAALRGPLTVANTAYFLAESNYVGEMGVRYKNGKPLPPNFQHTVIDEADTLEQVMMGFVDLQISGYMMRRLKLPEPEYVTKPESWLEWCVKAEDILDRHIHRLSITYKNSPAAKTKEELDELNTYRTRVKHVAKRIDEDPDNWVYDNAGKGMKLRAVRVGPYGQETIWRHSNEFLLMSATPISSAQLAEDVGIPRNQYATVTVDSQFPTDRRRIQVAPRASMTSKKKETEWPKMAEAVAEVINLYPSDRILVHTVSYALTQYLQGELQARLDRPIFFYLNSKEREQALNDFRQSYSAVMLAPSFDRGVDLPDDDVRVIIIAKVPFPYLGDKQVSKRFYGTGLSGKSWYATQTIRSIVQMTGRGMRHKDDWCVSYILDSQFSSNLWPNNRHLVPKWWSDAIHWQAPRR